MGMNFISILLALSMCFLYTHFISMPRLEGYRPRLVARKVRRHVCQSVCLKKKICYEPALSSKQDLLSMRGVDIKPQHKQTKTITKKSQGQMLQGSHLSGAEVPVNHDDIVLVQLVLTHSG